MNLSFPINISVVTQLNPMLWVVGTRNNRLTETMLLSTHNIEIEFQRRILEHEIRPLFTALSGQIKQFDPHSRALILDLKCLLRYLGNVSSKVI